MYSDKRLFSSLFFVQLVSSFLVVAGHYTADVDDYIQWTFWETALNQISRYGTVLLAIITGFFTAHSLSGKKLSGTRFFKGKMKYIYLPFFFSSLMYFFILRESVPVQFSDWKDVFTGQTAGHLYFIFMLCQYYVFVYVCRRIITKRTIAFFGLLFLVIQYAYINIVAEGVGGLGVRHFLPTWIFTIYLGHILYWYRAVIFKFLERNQLILVALSMLSVVSMVFFVLSSKLYTANHLTFVLATFILLVSCATFLNYVIDALSLRFQKGLTFYIYLLHPAFIVYANRFMSSNFSIDQIFHNKLTSLMYLLSIYGATLLTSLFLVLLVNRGFSWLASEQKQTA
ncbi:acyltransferase [Aneurinibacillus sp. BA2021]|nr:acyltransferase [Aneurinibacillus sp. BA2021]